MGIFCFVPLLSLLFSLSSGKKKFYIRPELHGNGDGSNWENAMNTLPETLTDRSTIFFFSGGDFSGGIDHTWQIKFEQNTEYRGKEYVQILKATEKNHGSDNGWDASLAGQTILPKIFIRTSNVLIDGREKYGFLIKSKNCQPSVDSQSPFYIRGPYVDGHEFTLKNIRLRNIEVQHCGLVGVMTHQAFDIFYSARPVEDVTIENCYWHDTNRAFVTITRGNRISITNNIFENAGNHQEAGAFGIVGNDITLANNIVTNSKNVFYGNGRGESTNVYIYNNVFSMSEDWEWSVYNLFDAGSSVKVNNVHINHNTIANMRALHLGIRAHEDSTISHYNNAYYNNTCNAIILHGCVEHDYNYLFNNFRVEGYEDNPRNIDDYLNEPNGQIGTFHIFDPSDDYNVLNSTREGKKFLGTPYDRDLKGRARCFWTRGAYEFDPHGVCKVYNPKLYVGIVVPIVLLCSGGIFVGVVVAILVITFGIMKKKNN